MCARMLSAQVLFANTAGRHGMTAGRDVWVMAFLREIGVPLERMARLEGGLNGWRAAGDAHRRRDSAKQTFPD